MRTRSSCLALALLLGCASTTVAPPRPDVGAAPSELDLAVAPEPSAEPSAATEPDDALVSVRPHINDPYLQADAVATWTAKLEGERREVIAEREAIVAALELEPGMVVADIGAGTGAFLQALSVELGEHGKLYAVDIMPQFVEHLRARTREQGLQNVEVIEGSETATNLPPASVDLLFLCDVYHHIEYPSVYLRSLHRTLRPDGRMIIIDFEKIPGKTSAAMMKHVRQDKPTLLAEVTAEGFVLEREIEDVPLDENYMLVFRKAEPAPPASADAETDAAPAPTPASSPVPPPALPLTVDPANYRMVLAGDVVIGLGGAGLVTMLVGLLIRSDALTRRNALGVAQQPDEAAIARQDRRIETGTLLAITGGAVAAALFTSGITLVAVGHSRERKRREALRFDDLAAVPLLGRERVGLSVGFRF